MKTAKILIAVCVCGVFVSGTGLAEGEEPSKEAAPVDKDAMIQKAVEQPIYFAGLIADARMGEGINYFVEILGLIEMQKFEAEVKTTKIAVMTAYMFKKWSSDARTLADKLAQSVPPELLSPIVAAAAVVMGNQAPALTDAFVSRVPEAYAQTLRNSGAHPETVLPPGLLVSIGLPVPHSVPATGREPTALPVAPPLNARGSEAGGSEPVTPPPSSSTPQDEEPPPPPPVPPTYSGQ